VRRLNFLYTHDNAMGYGRMGTQLARVFPDMGLEVIEDLREGGDVAPAALWASLATGAKGWYMGQYRALLTMWEASRLPTSVREGLHNFDQILVPSIDNVELYSRYHPRVSYVPLGVDPELWGYWPRQSPMRTFRVLADGRGVRKGTDLAVKAFKAAFPDRSMDPQPQLLLKGSAAARTYGGSCIQVTTNHFSDESEPALYGSAQVYLAPSRGEGWGLCPLQAMAQGCPTILTDAHGHSAFASLGIGIPAKPVPSQYKLFGDSGEWWEPSFPDLVDALRHVYENYDKVCEEAKLAAAVVRQNFTWRASALAITNALDCDLESGFDPREWVPAPPVKRYPVVLRLPHRMESLGTVFYFRPGQVFHERAEIKRMLFEAGLLDPVCLEVDDDDNGLTPEECERARTVSAANAACPTCGQELNSKPLYDYEDGGESGL
jgi:hypothetical protein